MAQKLPGTGLLGWLGRQLGYVKRAVRTDVTKTVVHREQRVEEAKLPDRPDVILRRTVIDEVIVEKAKPEGQNPDAEPMTKPE
jgi:hypothetical protein